MEPPIHNPAQLLWRRERCEVDSGCHQTKQKYITEFPGKTTAGGDSNYQWCDQGKSDDTIIECQLGKSPRCSSEALSHYVLTMGDTPVSFPQRLLCVSSVTAHITYRTCTVTYIRAQTDRGMGPSHINYIYNFQENVPRLEANNHTKYTLKDLDVGRIK